MKTTEKISVQDEMMSHMTEKYGEEFEFINIGTESWSTSFTEMIVHPSKFPNGRIVVRRNPETGVTSDNYTDFLMKDKIESEIQNVANEIYSKCKVLYTPGGTTLPEKIKPSMSVKEYSKAKGLPMPITICIDDSEPNLTKDEYIEKFRKALAAKEYCCNIFVFYLLEGKLELINDIIEPKLFTGSSDSDWSIIRGDFGMNDAYEFDMSGWRDIR